MIHLCKKISLFKKQKQNKLYVYSLLVKYQNQMIRNVLMVLKHAFITSGNTISKVCEKIMKLLNFCPVLLKSEMISSFGNRLLMT